MSILDTVIDVIAQYKGLDAATITEDTTFEALKISSLEIIEMQMDLEDRLDCEIEFTRKVATVGELAQLIEEIKNA